jgi:hypothetical protein
MQCATARLIWGIMRFIMWPIFLVVLAVSPAFSTQLATPNGEPPRHQLTLSVRAMRQVYRLGDKIEFESRLTNTGKVDVYLFDDLCTGFADGLGLSVYDSAGKEVPRVSDAYLGFLPDCIPPPPKPGDMSQFLRLPLGHFYGHTISLKIQDFARKPGEYDFVFEYHPFISASLLAESGFPKVSFWTSEEKPLKCRVRVKVIP